MNKKTKAVTSSVRTTTHTWWGQRWIEALEHGSRDVVVRLGKGRAYARDGRVHDLKLTSGKVTALVDDDDLETYKVCLQLEVFTSQRWQRVLRAMSQQALFTGQLLNGEMPRDIESVFHPSGANLFPTSLHDMDVDCSCEDWSSPCKHVAATHYVLAEALDHDPFLLFELRGLSREQVLSGVGRLRTGETSSPARNTQDQPTVQDAISLDDLFSEDFERVSVSLNTISFDFDVPTASGSLLHSLGKPVAWNVSESPQELLGTLVVQAKELAIALATDVHPDARLNRALVRDKVIKGKVSPAVDETAQDVSLHVESDVGE